MFELSFDRSKSERNVLERGLSFERMVEFDWETAVVRADLRRNYGEPRFRAIGLIGIRLHVAVYTPRYPKLHIISLRKANQRKVRFYEEETESRTD